MRTPAGERVVAGWSAWQRLEGEHRLRRWSEIAAVGQRFHEAAPHIPPPPWHVRRTDPLATADRAARDPRRLAGFRSMPPIEKPAAPHPSVHGSEPLIHGDLSGNVLLHPHRPPGIIDLSPY